MRKLLIYGFIVLFSLIPMLGMAHGVSACQHSSLYGPTQNNERLWRVALKICSSRHLSVQQIMIALLRTNPRAFNHGNVNGLKAGYYLKVPSPGIIQQISPQAALNTVIAQNRQWNKHEDLTHHHHQKVQKKPKIKAIAEVKPKVAAPSQPVESAPPQLPQPALQDIEQKLANITQSTQTFQQQISQRLDTLQQQSQIMQGEITELQYQLKTLAYHFVQFVNQETKTPKSNGIFKTVSPYWQKLKDMAGGGYNLNLAFASIVLFILLMWFILSIRARRRRNRLLNRRESSRAVENESETDTKDEYDFMGSEEGIPAKLDLARAYLDMGDYQSAEKVLMEVIAKGNEQQKQEAKALLAKINI